MVSKPQKINIWLNKIFESHDNGMLLDSNDLDSFEAIQEFLEAKDHLLKTPAIYYQAFADDNIADLVNILEEELRLKLGLTISQSCSNISEVIAVAELKTVVIDRSHLYTVEMIDELWQWLAKNQVTLILVASQEKICDSEILNHPVISQWEKFISCAKLPITLSSGYSGLLV